MYATLKPASGLFPAATFCPTVRIAEFLILLAHRQAPSGRHKMIDSATKQDSLLTPRRVSDHATRKEKLCVDVKSLIWSRKAVLRRNRCWNPSRNSKSQKETVNTRQMHVAGSAFRAVSDLPGSASGHGDAMRGKFWHSTKVAKVAGQLIEQMQVHTISCS